MFEWQPGYALGFDAMDSTHRDFVQCVDVVLVCDDQDLQTAFERLADHLARHFSDEQRWMAETAFPSAGCHLDEHAAVLKSVEEVRAVLSGRPEVARAFARELMHWFPGHAESMDMGLAHWMVTKRLGGSPVVFRGRAARPDGVDA